MGRLRIVGLLAAIAVVLCISNPEVLGIVLFGAIFPILLWVRAFRVYLVRLGVFVLPIGVGLLVVWGGVVGAGPGEAIGSSPKDGFTFAVITIMRLAILVGMFAAISARLQSQPLAAALSAWGLRGDLLLITLATFVMIPEGRLKAEQILISRYARGLVNRRGRLNNAIQLPAALRPMIAWTLKSAIDRSELWIARGLVSRSRGDLSSAAARTNEPGQPLPSHQFRQSQVRASITSADGLMALSEQHSVVALVGRNFSGRTRALRSLTDGPGGGGYVGPDSHSYVSGLAPTVSEELRLYAADSCNFKASSWARLLQLLHLDALADRNPTTLSGGEQSGLAVACAIAARPTTIAVDCALEQLDRTVREDLLTWLSQQASLGLRTVIADNRLPDLGTAERQLFSAVADIQPPPDDVPENKSKPGAIGLRTRFDYLLSSAPFHLVSKHLSFSYGKNRVLHDVDLDLEPRNLYLLEGANGAGKSTLAKLLCGVVKPSSGVIFRDGIPFHPYERPGHDVAYHFQDPDVQLFSSTVSMEVEAATKLRRSDPYLAKRSVSWLIECFGLAEVANEHPLDLPLVLRKRVAMAATLAAGCPWAILDEPTLGQDEDSVDGLIQIIHGLRGAGCGVIIITHASGFRNRLGDQKVLRIADGAVHCKDGIP